MHGYFLKKFKKNRPVNKTASSHFEGYMNTICHQEIPTKFLINKRQRNSRKKSTCNTKSRLCKNKVENVNYIISSFQEMSVQYYLPIRHEIVAKTKLKKIFLKENPDDSHVQTYYTDKSKDRVIKKKAI